MFFYSSGIKACFAKNRVVRGVPSQRSCTGCLFHNNNSFWIFGGKQKQVRRSEGALIVQISASERIRLWSPSQTAHFDLLAVLEYRCLLSGNLGVLAPSLIRSRKLKSEERSAGSTPCFKRAINFKPKAISKNKWSFSYKSRNASGR